MTRKIFPNNSLASEAFELVRFKNMSTAITDSPKRYNRTNWPPSSMIFGNRHQTTTPGLRASSRTPIQNANGMTIEARPTGTGKGSVNRKTPVSYTHLDVYKRQPVSVFITSLILPKSSSGFNGLAI